MSTLRLLTAAALLSILALLPACSSAPTAATSDAVTAREQASVDVLKARYKDVITGTDVQNHTLKVYVDVNNMYSMDEQTEADMKTQALALWKRTWTLAHPHKHATLRLSLRDYYGKEVYSATTRV